VFESLSRFDRSFDNRGRRLIAIVFDSRHCVSMYGLKNRFESFGQEQSFDFGVAYFLAFRIYIFIEIFSIRKPRN